MGAPFPPAPRPHLSYSMAKCTSSAVPLLAGPFHTHASSHSEATRLLVGAMPYSTGDPSPRCAQDLAMEWKATVGHMRRSAPLDAPGAASRTSACAAFWSRDALAWRGGGEGPIGGWVGYENPGWYGVVTGRRQHWRWTWGGGVPDLRWRLVPPSPPPTPLTLKLGSSEVMLGSEGTEASAGFMR
jgi:hypothetical protein